ncbi:MAG: hypothetical protein R6U63_08840 [Longimicrobiales bacterium]
MQAYTESTQKTVTREIGLTGKLVIGGTVSTGLLLGGYAVGAMALAGRMNGNALLLTSLGLFIAGAVVGLVASLVFGILGREDGRSFDAAVRSALKGLLFAVPAALIGAMLAGWIAMAVIGLYAGKTMAVGGSAVAAVAGLGIFGTTLQITRDCGRNLIRRARAAF